MIEFKIETRHKHKASLISINGQSFLSLRNLWLNWSATMFVWKYRHKMIKIFAKLGSNKSYTWYIWGERNRRLKLNETLSWVSIFHKVIEDAKAFSFSVNLTLRVDFSSKNWQPYQGTEVPERLRLPDGIISELFY